MATNIFLFGDQTADQQLLLRNIGLRKDNALLVQFLERASVALREEVRQLPPNQRRNIPDFLTVNDLVDGYYQDSEKALPIETALLTLCQLGHCIAYLSEHRHEHLALQSSHLIGLCSGLLAAAAVASASTVEQLVDLSIDFVRISFRSGAVVDNLRQCLSTDGDANSPWSTIVTGTTEKAANVALSKFHSQQNIPSSRQMFVSAVSAMAVTLTGPPATCQRFFELDSDLKLNHRIPIAVYGPYHAQHLFTKADINGLFDDEMKVRFRSYKPSHLIRSASTGKPIVSANTSELAQTVVGEMLQSPVRWDYLLEETVSELANIKTNKINIFSFGVSNAGSSFLSALRAGGQRDVAITDHTTWSERVDASNGRTQNDKIAIVGMAGRFPNAADHEALWDLLMKGLDVHRKVPADRFDSDAHCDPSGKGKNKSHTPYGCFIDEPGLFDPRFFNMSPREAAQTDPMGRLALVTAYEALEMSGYVPNRTPSTKLQRIGTFYGQTSDDWREVNAAENIDTYFITGGVRAFAPGRINYYFKFSGPSYSIDTACSSSLAAIQLACTSLWAGDCDTACAGGLNVLTNPDIFSGLSKGQFLSKTGSCKTYDNAADGYCRGDSCGTIILKRYEDAVADKDNILGCILGAATNHSAEAVSITHPHAGAQEFLYKKILANAGVDAHAVSYVEMHGTGTQAGDGIEMTSVSNVFAPRQRQRRTDQPVYLGAIKANIGHAEAASGFNSLSKVLLMMKYNTIPANVGIKGELNRGFPADLNDRNIHIPTKEIAWPRNGSEKRIAFLNNFSAAGGNTAILIEDSPLPMQPATEDPRSMLPITVTARSIASLKRNISNLQQYLAKNPSTALSSLSYTLTARRIQHNYRIAFPLDHISKAADLLQSQLKESYSPIAMVPTRVAFCFTGQGSQYTGLGRTLYKDLASFREDINRLDRLVQMHDLPSFMDLLNGVDVQKLSPVQAQLGMSCIQVALARMWEAWGVLPSLVVGHSLGEYAALHIAGVLSAADMILLVGRRAQLFSQSCDADTHGMLAVKGNVTAIQDALGHDVPQIACINGPEETVLCGNVEQMNAINIELMQSGLKATKLDVPFAFHSSQVDPILKQFRSIASSLTFSKPTVPILSPLLGETIQDAGIISPTYLARHARETVNFWNALNVAQKGNVFDEKTAWIEIGAHPVCCSMIKASVGPVCTAPSLRRGEDAWKTISTSACSLSLAGVNINFDEFHRSFNNAHELLTLPTYSFDNKKYWLDYHNNWTLTKGEAPLVVEKLIAKQPPALAPVEVPPKRLSTSCQNIVHESFSESKAKVIIQSSLADSKLYPVVCGHMVNGAALCPSSLYADMALTVSSYIYKEMCPGKGEPGFNVCNMEVPKPLIAQVPQPPEGQHIQVEANTDLSTGSVRLKFRSVQPDGTKIQDHAHCIVRFEDKLVWASEWSRYSYMVRAQIDTLQQKSRNGGAHTVQRGMAYKLFKALVSYDEKYRAMAEVVLDGANTEASARLAFQTQPEDGDFYCSPYHIDGACHISGFIVNASDLLDSEQYVYISHGWSAMKFSRPLVAGMELRNYVRMQPQPGKISKGDVYVMQSGEIIAVYEGIKFQQIPRKVMNTFLPPNRTSSPPNKVSVRQALSRKPMLPIKPVALRVAPTPITAAVSNLTTLPPLTKSKPKTMGSRPILLKSQADSLTNKMVKILAKEMEVAESELVDDAHFENLGVDSLLSLTISAIFREDLNLDISASLFTDYPTVRDMKKYFAQFGNAVIIKYDEEDDTERLQDSDKESHPPTNVTTPAGDLSTLPSSVPSPAPSDAGKDSPTQEAVFEFDDFSLARHIVAQEMGIDMSEVTDDTDLTEIGMDSLMALTILGELREKIGIDLPADFLASNSTIRNIEIALGMRPKLKVSVASAMPNLRSERTINMNEVSAKLRALNSTDISSFPPSTSVLLQGNPKTATKKIFLLPDGSGSATSYVSIPNLGSDIACYGMNCPFMKQPEKWDCGIEIISLVYLAEIKRRQPQGPYIVGGWSAGGVIAYAVAQALLAAGDVVNKLFLLDSPCPVDLAPLPARLHIFFNKIGLLGTGDPEKTPKWLIPHFASAIRSLSDYNPKPSIRPLPTYIVWCREGVSGNPGDPRPAPTDDEDPAPMTWLLNHRTDFGDNGWAQLCGKDNLKCGVMGGHHFSMMKPPYATDLGDLIREGLKWFPK